MAIGAFTSVKKRGVEVAKLRRKLLPTDCLAGEKELTEDGGLRTVYYITVEQAATELRVTRRRVRQLIESGELPAKKIKGLWALDHRDVHDFDRKPKGRPLTPEAERERQRHMNLGHWFLERRGMMPMKQHPQPQYVEPLNKKPQYWLPVREAAARLGVGSMQVWRYIQWGWLRAEKMRWWGAGSGQWHVDPASVEELRYERRNKKGYRLNTKRAKEAKERTRKFMQDPATAVSESMPVPVGEVVESGDDWVVDDIGLAPDKDQVARDYVKNLKKVLGLED